MFTKHFPQNLEFMEVINSDKKMNTVKIDTHTKHNHKMLLQGTPQ